MHSPPSPASAMTLDPFPPDVCRDRGRHFCSGAACGRVALEVLVERLPGLRLRDGFEQRYKPSVALRMLQTLPVARDSEP